jgi:hypothetical protein
MPKPSGGHICKIKVFAMFVANILMPQERPDAKSVLSRQMQDGKLGNRNFLQKACVLPAEKNPLLLAVANTVRPALPNTKLHRENTESNSVNKVFVLAAIRLLQQASTAVVPAWTNAMPMQQSVTMNVRQRTSVLNVVNLIPHAITFALTVSKGNDSMIIGERHINHERKHLNATNTDAACAVAKRTCKFIIEMGKENRRTDLAFLPLVSIMNLTT